MAWRFELRRICAASACHQSTDDEELRGAVPLYDVPLNDVREETQEFCGVLQGR